MFQIPAFTFHAGSRVLLSQPGHQVLSVQPRSVVSSTGRRRSKKPWSNNHIQINLQKWSSCRVDDCDKFMRPLSVVVRGSVSANMGFSCKYVLGCKNLDCGIQFVETPTSTKMFQASTGHQGMAESICNNAKVLPN